MGRKKCVKKDFPITKCTTRHVTRCEGWTGPKERKQRAKKSMTNKSQTKEKMLTSHVPPKSFSSSGLGLTKGEQTYANRVRMIEQKLKNKSLTSKIRRGY